MKKILIILSLIYFVSCKLSCFTGGEPKNNKDCQIEVFENEDEEFCYYQKILDLTFGYMSSWFEYKKTLHIE